MASAKKTTKRSSKATAAKKVVSKKKTATPKAKAPARPAQKKLRPKSKNTFKKEEDVSLPRSVTLAKLNPFRLPMIPQQLPVFALQGAGVFLLLMSGYLAYQNIAAYNSYLAEHEAAKQVAMLAALESLQQEENNNTQSHIEIVLDKDLDDTPLSGIVPIKVHGVEAQRVTLYAFNAAAGISEVIGSAQKITENTWKVLWDTNTFSNSDYKIRAEITTAPGQDFVYLDLHTYTVGNRTDDE